MRCVLLHYHILKNGGMTIEAILDRSFGDRFSKIETAERDGHVLDATLLSALKCNPDVRAVSSHQIRYPVPAVPGFLFFDLCFLRDPIDRIRSMYDYFREKPSPGDPVSDFAHQYPMGGFIERLIQEMPWYINDPQVNLLANGIANDCPQAQDLEPAIARIMRCSFPGVVDSFTESLIAGQHFLKPVFPELDCAEPAVNVSGGLGGTLQERVRKVRDACSTRTYAELLRLSAMDLELLHRARAEVERRYQLVPSEQAQTLRSRFENTGTRARENPRSMMV